MKIQRFVFAVYRCVRFFCSFVAAVRSTPSGEAVGGQGFALPGHRFRPPGSLGVDFPAPRSPELLWSSFSLLRTDLVALRCEKKLVKNTWPPVGGGERKHLKEKERMQGIENEGGEVSVVAEHGSAACGKSGRVRSDAFSGSSSLGSDSGSGSGFSFQLQGSALSFEFSALGFQLSDLS